MARYSGMMYKISNHLQAKTHLQIYNSFIHSHLNYCSLVWCFAAKSHIDSIFSKQNSGICAVMAGFYNFRYRDSIIPMLTKFSLSLMKVLTVKNVTGKNYLISMPKIRYFPNLLPKFVRERIPKNAPIT